MFESCRPSQGVVSPAVALGQPLPSAALMQPMSRAFVANLENFAAQHEIPLVQFRKGQRKDDVMKEYLPQVRQGRGRGRGTAGGPDGSGPFRVHGLLRNISSPCCDSVRAPAWSRWREAGAIAAPGPFVRPLLFSGFAHPQIAEAFAGNRHRRKCQLQTFRWWFRRYESGFSMPVTISRRLVTPLNWLEQQPILSIESFGFRPRSALNRADC
jgi:hypothetical protein